MKYASRLATVVSGCGILGFTVWTFAPLIVLAVTSFTVTGIVPGTGATWNMSTANYREVITAGDSQLLLGLGTSVIVATSVCILSLFVGLPAAYALARHRRPVVNLVGSWVFSTRFLPPICAAIPLFLLLRKLGIPQGIVALIMADLLIGVAFVVWVLRSYVEDLPAGLDDLATLDRLSLPGRITKVIAPSLRRPIAAVAAMTWLLVWNEYLFALLFCGSRPTMTVLIASWNTFQGIQWGPACATGMIAACPAIIVLVVSGRLIERSFSFGWRGDEDPQFNLGGRRFSRRTE